jgi:hypothetical protein
MKFYFPRKFFILIFSFFSCITLCESQTLLPSKVDEAVLSIYDRTYVSFGQGLGNSKTPYGVKKLKPLVFEGQISPNFILNISKRKNIGIVFFPKINIRMFNEASLPVRTPSYVPSILIFHQINIPFIKQTLRVFIKPENQLTFLTYRLIHHSNGQNGEYFIPGTDSINYNNGNFSSNAAEIAFSWSAIDSSEVGKSFMNGRISYEYQIEYDREPAIKDKYYFNKITLESHMIYSEKIKAYITYSLMWGTKHFGSRHSIDLFLVVKPYRKLANFSVFFRAYAGPDYYNLYYENTLRVCTIGIIADPLVIPMIKKQNKKRPN